jgi:hypothetical protein
MVNKNCKIKLSFLLFIFLPFLLFSCSYNKTKHLSQIPNWYVQPTANDSYNLYGVGEGYTIDEASKAALNNLAGKLITNISSESSLLLQSNNYWVNQQSRQNINQVIQNITFTNYRISNSSSYDGKIYVEITVDRNSFTKYYKQELENLNTKMPDLAKTLSGKNILEKRNILKEINDLSIQASKVNAILESIGARNVDFKTNNNLYAFYQNSYKKLLNTIEFSIEGKNVPDALIDVVVLGLNQEKIKVVRAKNINNPNLVIVQIKSRATHQKIYGSNIAKIKLDFTLQSGSGKTINSNQVEVSGSSVIGKQEAINAAIAQFNDKVAKDGILKIFGIKN